VAFNPQVFKKVLERKVVAPGADVFREGERANTAYIILRGKVQISRQNAEGQQVLLTEINEGEMFGELALMTPNSTRTARASTREGCEIAAISQAKLRERLDAADPVLRYWILSLSDRVLDLSKRISAPVITAKGDKA
jgi:CRP-like cAMP-binding protein